MAPLASAGLNTPDGLAFNRATPNLLYVADFGSNQIFTIDTLRTVDPTNPVINTVVSTAVLQPLNGPTSLWFDSDGLLYVANAGDGSVSRVDPGAPLMQNRIVDRNFINVVNQLGTPAAPLGLMVLSDPAGTDNAVYVSDWTDGSYAGNVYRYGLRRNAASTGWELNGINRSYGPFNGPTYMIPAP